LWNRHLWSISSLFYEQLLHQYSLTKKSSSQTLIREKLCKALLSEKGARKMFVKYTPEIHTFGNILIVSFHYSLTFARKNLLHILVLCQHRTANHKKKLRIVLSLLQRTNYHLYRIFIAWNWGNQAFLEMLEQLGKFRIWLSNCRNFRHLQKCLDNGGNPCDINWVAFYYCFITCMLLFTR